MPSSRPQAKPAQNFDPKPVKSANQQLNVLAISDAERKLFAALFGKLIENIMAETDK